MAQISPLASHRAQDQNESTDGSNEVNAEFLPLSAPELSQLPGTIVNENPTNSRGRIDRWQRKLLDLTLRNKLLNFRPTQQSIPIVCDNVAQLEDLLAADKRLRLISLPDQNPIGDRDPEFNKGGSTAIMYL